MKEIKFGAEVWEKIFASPLFRQTSILFRQIFKRNILVGDFRAMGITGEQFRRIQAFGADVMSPSLLGITGEEFKQIQEGYKSIPFPFCNLVSGTKKGRQRCVKLIDDSCARLAGTLKTDISTCHAGLIEIGVPIIVQGKYCGAVSTVDGLLLNEPNEAQWQEIVERIKDTGVNLDQLRKAYFEIIPISKELLEVMVNLLNMVVEEIVKVAIETEIYKDRIAGLEKALHERYQFSNIVGHSRAMREVYKLLDKAIQTDYPVIIQGETGTGKELIAKALHFNGPRKDKPFISENCAALAPGVLESELFGHVKGAFTGADRNKKGFFELADTGTLFLDEISVMDREMQKKLLRVMQEYEIRPVGGKETSKINVRFIVATNENLKKMVDKGEFRKDLYYRLNVITINLPPLRDRKDDIPLLVNYFLDKVSRETKTNKKKISEEVMQLFIDYDWPGNIRELENEIKRILALSETSDVITKQFISFHMTKPILQDVKSCTNKTLKEAMNETERSFVRQALQKASNNKSICAKNLGLTQFGLRKKMKRLGF
jgi:two-component system, NtrC family, response regulator HupR/HoxA